MTKLISKIFNSTNFCTTLLLLCAASLPVKAQLSSVLHKDINPTQIIATGSGVSALAVGEVHACAVINGGVRCWGLNWTGQLGNNTVLGSAAPVVAIPDGSGASAVAVGYSHSCAIVAGGVQCWGSNSNNQLGDGTKILRLQPVQVIATGSRASAIATNGQETCAVVDAGLQCWGKRDRPRTATNEPSYSTVFLETPTQVIASGYGVTQVALSAYETCAIFDGGLSCWYGSACAIAVASDKNCSLPTPIYPAKSKVTGLELFGTASCVIIDGGLTCHDRFTICGPRLVGSPQVCISQYFSNAVIAAQNAVALATMGSGYLCLAAQGGVKCRNYVGGELSVTQPYGTEFKQIIPANYGVTAIDSSVAQICAIKNGGVVCWGTRPELSLSPVIEPAAAVNRYRLSVTPTQGHLFTTDSNEYDALTQPVNGTYIAEGIDHKVYKEAVIKDGQSTVPYYRLYLKGIRQHFWTTDANEYNTLRPQTSSIGDEGIDGYLFLKAGVAGTVPLYRMVLNGTAIHHWTTDANEFRFLIANGWLAEGGVGNPNGVTGYVEPK
jgi:Repeat of unknown function (DUF5648)/Regulator of chromosome condensation (RCC1) repeat